MSLWLIGFNFNVLASYDDGKNAVITGDFGQGKYLLSGVHFELCADVYERYAVQEANERLSYLIKSLTARVHLSYLSTVEYNAIDVWIHIIETLG